MTNQMQEAPTREEGIVTRYKVDVGEAFPLSEKEKREKGCSRHEHEGLACGGREKRRTRRRGHRHDGDAA
ncbi:MAG: hypothetical protein CVT73_12850 [Alphaproteobacteria bacterium HGW-Alphaproteobacteria-12]|nr:MAG: hypothetical protein CVT73_12850 [Alphaproteobacteria bacterium HGW-Alphaproteobacteria-12]